MYFLGPLTTVLSKNSLTACLAIFKQLRQNQAGSGTDRHRPALTGTTGTYWLRPAGTGTTLVPTGTDYFYNKIKKNCVFFSIKH